MHLVGMRLLGRLQTKGGRLTLSDCSIESAPGFSRAVGRAVEVVGGDVTLTRVVLSGHLSGALSVDAASLTADKCIIQACRARSGGAILVLGGSNITLLGSQFISNEADESGGALQAISCTD